MLDVNIAFCLGSHLLSVLHHDGPHHDWSFQTLMLARCLALKTEPFQTQEVLYCFKGSCRLDYYLEATFDAFGMRVATLPRDKSKGILRLVDYSTLYRKDNHLAIIRPMRELRPVLNTVVNSLVSNFEDPLT